MVSPPWFPQISLDRLPIQLLQKHWSCSLTSFKSNLVWCPWVANKTLGMWPILTFFWTRCFSMEDMTGDWSRRDDSLGRVPICSITDCPHARLGGTQQVRHHLLSAVGWLVVIRGCRPKVRKIYKLVSCGIRGVYNMCIYILQPPYWFTLESPPQQWRARLAMMIPIMLMLVEMLIYHSWEPSVKPNHWGEILGPVYPNSLPHWNFYNLPELFIWCTRLWRFCSHWQKIMCLSFRPVHLRWGWHWWWIIPGRFFPLCPSQRLRISLSTKRLELNTKRVQIVWE